MSNSQPRVGDLCNEIHPIFRRQNFKNVSDFEYDALKPSLQFASLLLTTPELAGFPHAILVAPYKHVPHPDDESLDEWSFQEKGSKLSARDMAMYNLALTTLADMVVFVASSKTADRTENLCLHDSIQERRDRCPHRHRRMLPLVPRRSRHQVADLQHGQNLAARTHARNGTRPAGPLQEHPIRIEQSR